MMNRNLWLGVVLALLAVIVVAGWTRQRDRRASTTPLIGADGKLAAPRNDNMTIVSHLSPTETNKPPVNSPTPKP